MKRAWAVLWDHFADCGLPDAILCDNAFAGRPGLSWFDVQLLRLGIRPTHGRPFHPQTQGKVERLHATLETEVFPRTTAPTSTPSPTDSNAGEPTSTTPSDPTKPSATCPRSPAGDPAPDPGPPNC